MEGEEILKYLPEQMATAIKRADPDWKRAEEIRLRAGRPFLFYMNNQEYVLKKEGKFSSTTEQRLSDCYITDASDIRKILDRVSGHSLYAYQDELRQGYFTLEGGHRIGIAGKAVMEEGKIKTIKYLSFLNIRIAHEKKGCGQQVLPCLLEKDRLLHTIVLSPPGCGKTTLLRDMIRLVSNGFLYRDENGGHRQFKGVTVGVADERSEIGACVRGIPSNDIGIRTDVLDGCPKDVGIFMLLRSMGPRVIAADELGGPHDYEAILQAVNSGCVIMATAHGSSLVELRDKPFFAAFMNEHIFERYILLSGRRGKGTLEAIYDKEGRRIL